MLPFALDLHRLQASLELARQRAQRASDATLPLLLAALLALVLGIALALATGGYHGGFHSLQTFAHAALPDIVWATLTNLGDGKYLFVLSLLFVCRRPEIFWAMVVAGVISALGSHGMKLYFDELRPPAVLAAGDIMLIGRPLQHHSFPSGHTLTVFMFVGVLFAFSKSWTTRLLLLSAAALVGVSRVAVGVHWPQDVLAGAASGLVFAALGVWIARYWQAGLRPLVHLGLLVLPAVASILLLGGGTGDPSTWIPYPLLLVGWLVFVRDCRVLVRRRLPRPPVR